MGIDHPDWGGGGCVLGIRRVHRVVVAVSAARAWVPDQAEEGPCATTEPPWGWATKDDHAAVRAVYLAGDVSLTNIAKRFGMSREKLTRLIRVLNWPKRKRVQSAESTVRRLETCRARGVRPGKKRTRPLPGTNEAKLFRKIADRCRLGAAAAHAELRRGA